MSIADKLNIETGLDPGSFWTPEIEIEQRSDGSIIMFQKGSLTNYLPTLADYLDKWADATPDHVWIARREPDGAWRRISYGEARTHARAMGASLLKMGLGPERPLAILSENSLEHALLGLACTYVGIPFAPVSPAYSLVSKDHAKLKDIVETLKPGAIFADDGHAFAPACSAIATEGQQIVNSRNLMNGAVAFDSLLAGDPEEAAAARAWLSTNSVVKYLFTSGSTGSPKAVINTNKMICAMQAMVRDCYRFLTREPPVVLDWAPWNHTAAGNKVFYLVLTNGGTYYIDDGRPTVGKFEETLRNLREIPCTWYFNVPVGWDMLVDALERDKELAATFFSRLGMMFYAGADMAQHTWDRLRAVGRRTTGHEVLVATSLGATETAPFALACTEVQERPGNVGVPALGLKMKLVPKFGKLELRLKGPSITPGYLGDPATTAEAFDEEGFYRMGDALRPVDPRDLTKGLLFDGRIDENFKLAAGTWVAVGAVRAALVDTLGGLIRDAVITGEDRTEVGALLILSDRALEMDKAERNRMLEEGLLIAAARATGSASRVRRALVLNNEPSLDRGEITEKGSLNQRAMRASNANLLELLYTNDERVISV